MQTPALGAASVLLLLLLLPPPSSLRGVAGQQGRPTVPGPNYPCTYQLNRSTIIMPCNYSGLTSAASITGWGIVDFDWSNAKAIWARAKPMNCEEMMLEQVHRAANASPGSMYWVYRNGVKALPWFTSVRVKLNDPDYQSWFLRFSSTVRANHSAAHVPVCDTNYHPPRCSDFYHDQQQTPEYPGSDGNSCAPPGCDVGLRVPVGEYLFDPRAANVSVHGQTFVQWFIDEYLFGPTGAADPHVSGCKHHAPMHTMMLYIACAHALMLYIACAHTMMLNI
eukprot:SAG31_NODE_2226_length_6149_cov_9.156198_3_plen_279_part_00